MGCPGVGRVAECESLGGVAYSTLREGDRFRCGMGGSSDRGVYVKGGGGWSRALVTGFGLGVPGVQGEAIRLGPMDLVFPCGVAV